MIRCPLRSYCKECLRAVGLYHEKVKNVDNYYCELCKKFVLKVVDDIEE